MSDRRRARDDTRPQSRVNGDGGGAHTEMQAAPRVLLKAQSQATSQTFRTALPTMTPAPWIDGHNDGVAREIWPLDAPNGSRGALAR